MTHELVDVWEAHEDEALDALTRVAQDRTREPTFRCTVLSSTGDALGLQVLGDDLPSGDAKVVYVEGRGAFELVRVERWPPALGGKKPRVLLKLSLLRTVG
jgi:hypothetical protein